MTDAPLDTDHSRRQSLDHLVGSAVRTDRQLAGLTLAELSARAQVSTAMISKIERGQVSASLSTLAALAEAIGVPVVNFFAGTAERSDVSYVAAGQGMDVQRLGSAFHHAYRMVGRAESGRVGLESFVVELSQPLRARALYQHRGVEFLHMLEGQMAYRCGEARYELAPGDSLTFDGHVDHGPTELLTETVRFLAVKAQAQLGD